MTDNCPKKTHLSVSSSVTMTVVVVIDTAVGQRRSCRGGILLASHCLTERHSTTSLLSFLTGKAGSEPSQNFLVLIFTASITLQSGKLHNVAFQKMALSPRELPHFFPDTFTLSSGQRFQGSLDFRNNLTLGLPKFPILPPAVDANGLQDHNITLLLQQWLLHSLKGTLSTLPKFSDFQARIFPPTAAAIRSITEPYKQDFILQDLHQKYKKILADYESAVQRKLSLPAHFNDTKRLSSKWNTTSTPSTFPYVNNLLYFPFPAPTMEKYPKPLFSHVPSQFYPLPSHNTPPQVDSTPKTTIHHQCVGTKDETPSQERRQTADTLKDKKTHKCMYCGKLYSRKYGLKIHIRTHTGYKPLKCKVREVSMEFLKERTLFNFFLRMRIPYACHVNMHSKSNKVPEGSSAAPFRIIPVVTVSETEATDHGHHFIHS